MVFRYPALPTQLASTQLGEPLSPPIAGAAVAGLSQAAAHRRRARVPAEGRRAARAPGREMKGSYALTFVSSEGQGNDEIREEQPAEAEHSVFAPPASTEVHR